MNENMQNSTLINLINDDIKSITSERLSPITVQELELSSASSDNEVCDLKAFVLMTSISQNLN